MARQSFIIRPLDAADLDRYDTLAREHGSFFDRVKWTGLFDSALKRCAIFDRGDELRGGFCYFALNYLMLRMVKNPPFTPQIGPFFQFRASNPAAANNERRDLMTALVEYFERLKPAVISISFSKTAEDALPFYWKSYKVVPRFTYCIDLRQPEDLILKAMTTDRRKSINKALKDELRVEEVHDCRELRNLVLGTFERQRKDFPKRSMEKMLEIFPPGTSSFAFITYKDSEPVAGVYAVHDEKTAYYLLGGYKDENAHHGAGALAMFHAILKAKSLGLEVFDFEGSAIPPIERYFRGFGGRLVSYFSAHKAWLPLEILLKFKKRQWF
jgi:hypothetical protein